MTVGKREVVLGVWDTAGSERYESMVKMYYRLVTHEDNLAPCRAIKSS